MVGPVIAEVPDIAGRLRGLSWLTTYGPDYNRNVHAAVKDSQLFLNRGELEAAERYLLLAEMRAGLITFEQYQLLTQH